MQYVISWVRIYSIPLPETGYGTRSIFKERGSKLSFSSPKLVAYLRLENPVCLTVYSRLSGEQMDSFPSQEH